MKRLIAIALSGAACITTAQAGEEVPLALGDVPDTVLQAVKTRFDTIALISANTETETDGFMVYEIQGTIPGGEFLAGEYKPLTDEDGELMSPAVNAPAQSRKVEFDVTADAEFDEIEIEFAADMVPGAVMKAVNRAYPAFSPQFIEASYSASMDVVGYEFSGMQNGQKLDLEVSPSGRHIQEADD
ncbi:hypothetical protein Q4485_15900 [Granulosicoccaceae sp. 1_MG-2023]|nr:hypothetical protein [Granulosicoccaceae sp. 1_MG-2023]